MNDRKGIEMFKKESLLASCIRKAVKSDEDALSTQHVRIIVIDTYKAGVPQLFWEAVLQLQLKTHHISTWKLCQLLHKVLKNGQKLCTYHGIKYCHMLLDIGNYWSSCTSFSYDGYGVCIQKYMKLLVNKLKFHERNTQIPPSLALSREEFETIVEYNSNDHFQLCVDILDYLEDIISLQEEVFSTHLTYAIGSVRACRFMALTTLLEESKLLYFHLVQIMHQLHQNLKFDTLEGHRNRFLKIFSQLKLFYDKANNLDMFASLLWIPKLSETPPEFEVSTKNFKQKIPSPQKLHKHYRSHPDPQQCSEYFLRRSLSQKDLVVYMNGSIVDSDFSDFSDDDNIIPESQTTVQPSAPPLEILIDDRDQTIRELKQRVGMLENEIKTITLEKLELRRQLDTVKGKSNEMSHSPQISASTSFKSNVVHRSNINELSSSKDDKPQSSNFSNVKSFWANNEKIMQFK